MLKYTSFFLMTAMIGNFLVANVADTKILENNLTVVNNNDEKLHQEFLGLVTEELQKTGELSAEKAEQLAMQFYGSKKENRAFTAGFLTGVVVVALGYAAWYGYNKYQYGKIAEASVSPEGHDHSTCLDNHGECSGNGSNNTLE